jgi:hypothetical protein
MQTKTIKRVIVKKLEEWLLTINDEKLRQDVKKNLLVSGGSIASMFLNEKVNDFDIYIQDMEVLIRLAKYYCPNDVLDGRLRNQYLENHYREFEDSDYNVKKMIENLESDLSEMAVRFKNLKPDQVRLNISSVGVKMQTNETDKYQVAFLSPNAISLTDDIQIVLRFNGNAETIHKTFDFIHATNYFTFEEGLVTNIKALESLLSKDLKYQGSLYPLTSIIRIKKFLKRGWTINAGEMLKIMFQISELDLKNPEILEEQLIGVDIAYFAKLIEILRGVSQEKMTSNYINEIVDRVFNEYDESEDYNPE